MSTLRKIFLISLLVLFSIIPASDASAGTDSVYKNPQDLMNRNIVGNSLVDSSGITDPTLSWNTFLGGVPGVGDPISDIAVDGSGNIFVSGITSYTWGVPVSPFKGLRDAFVAKLSSNGVLQWNTFLGSAGYDEGPDIALDRSGNVYVAGTSDSSWGTPVNNFVAGYDAFVAKLNGSGVLQWNTFMGASDTDISAGLAVDGSGNSYLMGLSASTWGTPVKVFAGGYDVFVTKLNTDGVRQWNTFVGSDSYDLASGIGLDESGKIYVAGVSYSAWGTPVNPFGGGTQDGFVAALDGNGTRLWHTFLGSTDYDSIEDISVNGGGNVYVIGESNIAWGTPVNQYTGNRDVFVAKLNASGMLQWNTFMGSSIDDYAYGISADGGGNTYVTGESYATWGTPVNPFAGGNGDAFVAKVNSTGARQWNTFLGSAGTDYGSNIEANGNGYIFVTGYSDGTWGTPVNPHPGGQAPFIAKITEVTSNWTIMVYLDGDNDKDKTYEMTFNRLEKVADNPNVNIMVAWDRLGSNNSAYYKVKYDTDTGKLANYVDGVDRWSNWNGESLTELNMADSKTLSDFIIRAREIAPAQHYALIISDHGNGLTGLAQDDTSHQLMTVHGVGTALSIGTSNGSNKLDIVFADACLMGMIEDGYQIRDYANYYVASENPIANIPWGTHPFEGILHGINASTTPSDLAHSIVSEFAYYFETETFGILRIGYTFSTVDLTKISPLAIAVGNMGNAISDALKADENFYKAEITNARNNTQKFDSNGDKKIDNSDEYLDLADLALQFKNIPNINIQNSAQAVINAVNEYVVENRSNEGTSIVGLYPDLKPDHVHGVSIFFPTGNFKRSFYNGLNLDFAGGMTWFGTGMMTATDTEGWGSFLVNFVESITPSAPDNPNPPELISPLDIYFFEFLPLVIR